MIYDICTFNGEYDLFELRYNILKDYVDEFRVIEFDKTFSGKDKEPLFPQELSFLPKVKYYFITEELYSKYKDLAENSPNTKGAEHWKREFMQKESIKDCLEDLKNDDIVFIGDCDEIWNPKTIGAVKEVGYPFKYKLIVYTYYLNNRSSEDFWGTLASEYKNIKNKCLNHLRSDSYKWEYSKWGWHFTSMGGYEAVKKKLDDSYTDESYWSSLVQDALEYNIKSGRDFLGRDFTYQIDESEWPQYLKDNRQKYIHLLK